MRQTMQKIQNELLLKEIRTAYWELNHSIPTLKEIDEFDGELDGVLA